MSKAAERRLCRSLLAAIFVLGCRASPSSSIRIGVLPYAGSSLGMAMTRGAALAAKEVNETDSIVLDGRRRSLELSILEIRESPEAAVTAAYRLINQEHVVAIVGPHYSREAIPAAAVAEGARIPMICPASTHPATTEGRHYVFRIPFSDVHQAAALARFVRHDLGLGRAAVLYEASDPHNQGLADLFGRALAAAGGKVVASETYTADAKRDFSGQLRRIRQMQPEVLFLPGRLDDASLQALQARRLGIESILLGSDMWRGPGRFGPAREGAFFAYPKETAGARHDRFVAAYERAFGRAAEPEVAHSYDAIGLFAAAIRRAGKADPESIRNGLLAIGPYQGATGTIRYNGSGDPSREVVIFAVRNGATAVQAELPPD